MELRRATDGDGIVVDIGLFFYKKLGLDLDVGTVTNPLVFTLSKKTHEVTPMRHFYTGISAMIYIKRLGL